MNDFRKLLDLVEDKSEINESIELLDSFEIELEEDFVVESGVVGFKEDGIIIEGDNRLIELMQEKGIVFEHMDDGDFDPEYDDEAGMAKSNLHTMARAVKGLHDTIQDGDNLPEWCQEKIAVAKGMMVAVWDYILSQKEQGINEKMKMGATIEPIEEAKCKICGMDPCHCDHEDMAEGFGKNIKRGLAGWGAFDKDKPADVVKRVKGQDTDTLKALSNRGSTGKGSPAELQQKAISRELKRRGEQGMAKGEMDEAKYQGREVPLGKPMAGDSKKSKVYVRKPNGKVVKVNFGDKNMRIKKSNPKRRKSFRARHHCENPGPRWKARYWSCRAW